MIKRALHTVASPARYPLAMLFGALIALAALVSFPALLPSLERSMFPVVKEWRVVDAKRDGDDLILSGTMIRERGCRFLPPVVARTQDGVNLKLVHESPAAGATWAPGPDPQRWGPWRIVGGAGKVLDFSGWYECHTAWVTVANMGKFDGRKL